jgi:hypothetical protein
MSTFPSHSREVVIYVFHVILLLDSEFLPFQPYVLVFLMETNCVLCEVDLNIIMWCKLILVFEMVMNTFIYKKFEKCCTNRHIYTKKKIENLQQNLQD